jgi:hypothetical protein
MHGRVTSVSDLQTLPQPLKHLHAYTLPHAYQCRALMVKLVNGAKTSTRRVHNTTRHAPLYARRPFDPMANPAVKSNGLLQPMSQLHTRYFLTALHSFIPQHALQYFVHIWLPLPPTAPPPPTPPLLPSQPPAGPFCAALQPSLANSKGRAV